MLPESDDLQDDLNEIYETEDVVEVLQDCESQCVVERQLRDDADHVDNDDAKEGPLKHKMVNKFIRDQTTLDVGLRGSPF